VEEEIVKLVHLFPSELQRLLLQSQMIHLQRLFGCRTYEEVQTTTMAFQQKDGSALEIVMMYFLLLLEI
jgi:hypothetical protein